MHAHVPRHFGLKSNVTSIMLEMARAQTCNRYILYVLLMGLCFLLEATALSAKCLYLGEQHLPLLQPGLVAEGEVLKGLDLGLLRGLQLLLVVLLHALGLQLQLVVLLVLQHQPLVAGRL